MMMENNREDLNPWDDVSTGTQTEGDVDTVDSAPAPPNQRFVNGEVVPIPDDANGGFLANMFSRTLFPSKKRNSSTQTEELDPVTARGRQLSYYLIQELALENSAPSVIRDDVYESFCFYVTEILDQHAEWFDEMVDRVQVCSSEMFSCVANELFEANANNGISVTWGRIISLYAFAVRLAREYSENSDNVETITANLTSYVAKNVIPFVRTSGGWEKLVNQFPTPDSMETPLGRAVLWSGLCMGLVATMYISSQLR